MWMPMCQQLKEYDAWYQSKDMKIKKMKYQTGFACNNDNGDLAGEQYRVTHPL